MEYYLFSGKYNEGIEWIQKEKKKQRNLAQLNQYEGDFYKLKGDLEEALIHWEESNRIRSINYKRDNYHLAWNYALLSNYYFEKIETKLAKQYADSCFRLIQGLTPKQQSEIEIYKIWNILAQSNKQYVENKYIGVIALKKYNWIRGFYAKSKTFIIENKLPNYYLAKTYHLIGNSYIDNIHAHLKMGSVESDIVIVFKHAENNYNKALYNWTQTFGNVHHERAKTLYLLGILNMLFDKEHGANRYSKPSIYFDQAIEAFGINVDQLKVAVLKHIPNKEDALQCLRFKNETLFKQIDELNKIELLQSAEGVSQQAVKLWEITYDEFKSNNTNQLLGIYNLVPFKDVIQLETLKRKNNIPFSINRIFNANEKLKYYDFRKLSASNKLKQTSIKAIQRKLKINEVFLDFLSNQYNQYFILVIEKNKVSLKEIDHSIPSKIQAFQQAIIDLNYADYSELGVDLFQGMFNGLDYKKWKKIVICPDGDVNPLPFEALLWSDKNVKEHDYRRLDYLLHHWRMEYALTPSYFVAKSNLIPFSIAGFAPTNSDRQFSSLPFSFHLMEQLSEMQGVAVYTNEAATKNNFLASESSILHFSGHGLVDSKSSVSASLVFSDTLLTFTDLKRFKCPKLVVLNACNSSNGKIIPGDGVDGFVRAFHAAGAKITVANLWEVDDKVSNELFLNFYKNLSSKRQIAKVMQETKLNYLKTCSNSVLGAPYYWAGHRVIGDGVILQNEKTPQSLIAFWIVGVLVSVVYLFLFRCHLKSI
jgi:CHAT domain-containing protein